MIIFHFFIALITSIIVIGIIRFLYYYFIKYLLIIKIIKKDKKTKFDKKEFLKRTILEKIWYIYQQFKLKKGS